LEQVADIQDLHPAERDQGLLAEMPQDRVDGIEHVGADHAYFIDHQ